MKHFLWSINLLTFLLVYACTDVVEEDIENTKIVLKSPPNNFKTTSTKIDFWWNEVEEANEYKIQIVKPSFNYVEQLIIDSIVLENKYSHQLQPGNYQWKVIAKNNASQTESSIWSLTVDSAKNISDITINLIKPHKGDITNIKIHDFTWQTNDLIDDYRFEIRYDDWNTGNLVFASQILTSGTYNNNEYPLEDGNYVWGVQGLSNTSNTIFSTSILVIDATSPGKPILSQPANESSQNIGQTSFSWVRPFDSGTKIKDSLFIYSNPSLTSLVRPIQILENTVYTDSLPPGIYYWRVKSFDEALNSSGFSDLWNFEIK